MNIASFLAELRAQDIRVWMDGERLRCDAPPGVLTPQLRERLRASKEVLIDFLRSAEALRRQQRAIVPLQPQGSRLPLFVLPGHNGDVYSLRILARCLGPEQPFYGLQPPGADGQGEPLESIEEIADHFAKQIREFRPEGPYLLAGLCAGGSVAFELAQQLRRSGGTIGLLAMIACPHPHELRRLPTALRNLNEQWRRVRRHAAALLRPLPEQVRYVTEALTRHRVHMAEVHRRQEDPLLAQRARVERATLKALARYRPAPYHGPIHLFVPGKEWTGPGGLAARWRGVAKQIKVHYGPTGSNRDDILGPLHGPAFAEIFLRCLKNDGQSWRPARTDRK